MTHESPLNASHTQAEASFLWHGSGSAKSGGSGEGAAVVETFGELEGEYAALRKGCVVIDFPQRGVIRVTGADRVDFLNRMVTNEMKGMRPFGVREAFLLNRKGRIDADLLIVELPEEAFIEVDILVLQAALASLQSFVFGEDIELANATEHMHRLALHGPTSAALLHQVCETMEGPTVADLASSRAVGAAVVRVAGRRVIVDRRDETGEVGFGLLMEREGVAEVYQQILERGLDGASESGDEAAAPEPGGGGGYRLRPAGWGAFNIARVEAGTPIFNLDFAAGSLPAESGVLERRVSFTKGCYPGQEVVARMKSLGHPKQRLVGLRFVDRNEGSLPAEAQPVTGALLSTVDGPDRKAVGAVTSSVRSPMLGDAIICFAQVRWEASGPGTLLEVETDAGPMRVVTRESLEFWRRKNGP